MKKIFLLITSLLLLVGCVETMALLGPATSALSGGNIVQSSVSSAVNYSVKKQTGKSPMQHVVAYAEEKNPHKNKERCVSFIKKTNSEACAIIKKQVEITQVKIKNKTNDVLRSISLTNLSARGKAFNKARKTGKNSFVFKGKIYNTKFKEDISEKMTESKNLFVTKKTSKNNYTNKFNSPESKILVSKNKINKNSKINDLNQHP